ncbi:MAG: hypothetical protein HY608_01310 [Planctomycetes bacterium]|nr:hypothetical protein [Planctomycetota bacterium]
MTGEGADRRGPSRTLLLLLALWLGVRALAASRTEVAAADGTIFGQMAREARSGEIALLLDHDQHPAHPALLSIGLLFTDRLHLGCQIGAILFSLLTFAVARRIGAALDEGAPENPGPGMRTWVPILFALWPPLVRWTANFTSEPAFVTFALAGLLEAQGAATAASGAAVGGAAASGWARRAAAAGVWFALAHLTRMEGFFLPCACALGFALLAARGALPGARASGIAGTILLVFASGIAPYILHLRASTGEWRTSRKKDVTYFVSESLHAWTKRLLGDPGAPVGQAPQQPQAPPAIVDPNVRPSSTTETFDRVRRLSFSLLKGAGAGTAALLAAWLFVPSLRGGRTSATRGWNALAGSAATLHACACAALIFRSNYLESRHAMPVAACLLPWAAQAARALARRTGRLALPARTALAVLLAACAAESIGSRSAPERVALRRCGEWLAEGAPPRSLAVIVEGPHAERVAFYAGARVRIFIMSGEESLEAFTDRLKPRLVIYDERLARRVDNAPQFAAFLARLGDPSSPYQEVRPPPASGTGVPLRYFRSR